MSQSLIRGKLSSIFFHCATRKERFAKFKVFKFTDARRRILVHLDTKITHNSVINYNNVFDFTGEYSVPHCYHALRTTEASEQLYHALHRRRRRPLHALRKTSGGQFVKCQSASHSKLQQWRCQICEWEDAKAG